MWVIIVLLSVGLFNMFQDPNKINSEKNSLAFSNFLNEVDAWDRGESIALELNIQLDKKRWTKEKEEALLTYYVS